MAELLHSGVDLSFKQKSVLGTPDVHDILTSFKVQMATNTWYVCNAVAC